MNNYLEQLKTFIQQGGSPQQLVNQIADKNPMLKNIINMAQNGDNQNIESFARNMFKEQGRDFDKEFTEFMKNFK